jgi:hypothetical protein
MAALLWVVQVATRARLMRAFSSRGADSPRTQESLPATDHAQMQRDRDGAR